MTNNKQPMIEKTIFLLIETKHANNLAPDSTQIQQLLPSEIFQPLYEKIVSYLKDGFNCSIRLLLVESFIKTESPFFLNTTMQLMNNRPFQPSKCDLQLQAQKQLAQWLLSKHITTVTVSHFLTPAIDCVSNSSIRDVLPTQHTEQLGVIYTWIYMQLVWQFAMETRAQSTFLYVDFLVSLNSDADISNIKSFFSRFTFLLPKHTQLLLSNHSPIAGNDDFIFTNIAKISPIFISHFFNEKGEINTHASKEHFLNDILNKEVVKCIRHSSWIKTLYPQAVPQIRTSRQIISDLITKLSVVKNISPPENPIVENILLSPQNKTENSKPPISRYTIEHSEWVFFNNHCDDLQNSTSNNRRSVFKVSAASTEPYVILPSHHDDISLPHTNISGIDLLKQKIRGSTNNIGNGSFGSVYETMWQPQNSAEKLLTAVKVEPINGLRQTKEKLKRKETDLLLEHQLTMKCTHPSIVSYVASGADDSSAYLIMEHGGHSTLKQFLANKKATNERLTHATVLHIFVQLCLAIDYLHHNAMIHRDIKSENILIDNDYNITLIDLGFSIKNEHQTEKTSTFTNERVGTPYYMAPEICLGEYYGFKADIWSIGIVLYEMLTFNRPFVGVELAETMAMICNPFIAMLPINTLLPNSELNLLIHRLLDKNQETRIDSVQDIFSQFPLMRNALTFFFSRFESTIPTENQENESKRKKYLFSIGMLKKQCNSIFKACQSYDNEKAQTCNNQTESNFTR